MLDPQKNPKISFPSLHFFYFINVLNFFNVDSSNLFETISEFIFRKGHSIYNSVDAIIFN